MSNVEQGSDFRNKHRYSIKQLLEISQSACNRFDLSKFSFDAARAGVIPPLGDCAPNLRRTSTARTRIPSAETAITFDGAMGPRSESVQEPARRPHNPPEGALAQQNAGFARFLKKHSSPTHQRVTAGGRIVPMESYGASPPKFSLDIDKSREPVEKLYQMQPTLVNGQDTAATADVLAHAQLRSAPKSRMPTSYPMYPSDNLHPTSGMLPNRHQGEQLTSSDVYPGAFNGSIADQYLPLYGTSDINSYFPSSLQSQYIGYVPWYPSPISHSVSMHSPSNMWPCHDGLAQLWQPSIASASELMAQRMDSARNSLETWTSCYQDLDQQLKSLDRQRAMTNLNPDITSQRHLLVQQRSDTKDVIDGLRKFLEGCDKAHPAVQQADPTLPFNIDAPVYVPRRGQTAISASEPTKTPNDPAVNAGTNIQKPRCPVPRRPIPIVPPPKLQTDLPPALSSPDTSPDTPVARDEWTAKIGPALPEFQQQQSETAASLSSMLSHSSLSDQSRDSLQPAPEGGFFSRNIHGPIQDDDSSSDEEVVQEAESILIPSDSESLQAQQLLDALQKPPGFSTRVRLPDGGHIDIQGQNLKSLPTPVTSVLENNIRSQRNLEPPAWQKNALSYGFSSSKPTKAAATNPLCTMSQADRSAWNSSHGDGKENIIASLHKKAATDAFHAQSRNSQSQEDLFVAPANPRFLRGYSKLGHSEGSQPWRGSTHAFSGEALPPDPQDMPLYEHFDANVKFSYFDRSASSQNHNHGPNQANTSTEWSSDGFANKGYSSVSLQNVHAMAQVPQSLDGPTDNGGRGAAPRSSFVGKVRSPRLFRRTTNNGGA